MTVKEDLEDYHFSIYVAKVRCEALVTESANAIKSQEKRNPTANVQSNTSRKFPVHPPQSKHINAIYCETDDKVP